MELVGGPLDGMRRRAVRDKFVWVDRDRRCYRAPGRGRHLYMSIPNRGEGETFLFAGHTHALCRECGSWNRLLGVRPLCGMCGHRLDARVAADG